MMGNRALALLLAWLALGLALAFGRAVLSPFFPGGQVGLSVLFSVSLALILLAGLLFYAYRWFWHFSDTRQGAAPPSPAAPPRLWSGHMIVFLGLTLAIGLTGYFYTRYENSQDTRAAQEALLSIADLKVGQISNWYHDRLVNARAIFANKFIQNGAAQFIIGPSSPQSGRDLSEWFRAQEERGYSQVFLFDAQGAVRLSSPPDAPAPDALHHPDFQTALRTGDVVATDLHRDPGRDGTEPQEIHLSFWIPIGDSSAGERKTVGVVLVEADPNDLLYPLIQSWPTSSPTAETLLVRRDGDEVVYLNELRHRKNTALKLRFAMDQSSTLPATLAVQGREGIVESLDYRQVPVLAAMRSIPGTPWFMVAKIDLDEIRAPMRRQTLTTMAILAVLILASALGVGFQARQRDSVWLRKQLAVEQERKAIAERYVLLNKHANDIILLTDRDEKILEANDQALRSYGYSLEEMQSMTLEDLCGPKSATGLARHVYLAETIDGTVAESVHHRRDGSEFPVECSTHTMEIGGGTYQQSIIRDITERKRAERELRATRDYLEKLLDYANAPIIVWNPDLIITRFNHAFERLAGQSAEDMIGRHLSALFPADSREESLSKIAHTLTGEHWESVEIPVLRTDGTTRTALWNSANVYGEDGTTLVATIAQGQDITGRKQAEMDLRQSEERYRMLFDTMLEGFCVVEMIFDPDGKPVDYRFLEINAAFEDQTELRDVRGRRMRELAPDHEAHWFETYGKVAQTGAPVRFVNEAKALGRWFDVHAYRIGGPESGKVAILFNDITERKRAEQELRATRDYLEKLLDYANAPIIVWSPDLEITRFNHAFERLTGKTAENVVGQHLSMLFPVDTQEITLAEVTRASAGEHWESVEIPILRSDGSVRIALWNSANVYAGDGTLTATIAQGQDITERKRVSLDLERLNEELDRKNQELEQIVYVASHDLRSPLVNVQGFSTELGASVEELRTVLNGISLPAEHRRRLNELLVEDVPESLGYILTGIAKMDTLISGLLRLSRLGRAALSIAPVDMGRLVGDVARTLEFQIKEARVSLSVGALPPCLGDASQLNQAISNLLSNSLKYLDPARPGVVRITGVCENGRSVYCIEDNGIGIAAKHQAKVFELYHRLNPDKSDGEGLGLTIVRTVLERQHGRIWLESEPGVGTRFYVALPGVGDTGKDSS